MKPSLNQNFVVTCTLAVACTLAGVATAQETKLAARKEGWQQYLESQPFLFEYRGYEIFFTAIDRFSGPCQLHIVRDPEHEPHLAIKLVREGNEILSLECDRSSTFAAAGNAFFFADFSSGGPGCFVRAFDMTTGKQLWKTKQLNGFGLVAHSAYHNQVVLRVPERDMPEGEKTGDALLVVGRESFGDYMTVVDIMTGQILAQKIYREGFATIREQR